MSDSPRNNWQIVAYNPTNLRITMTATTLGLETAIRQAPSFSGGTDNQLSIFITKCEFLFSNVTDTIKPFNEWLYMYIYM